MVGERRVKRLVREKPLDAAGEIVPIRWREKEPARPVLDQFGNARNAARDDT